MLKCNNCAFFSNFICVQGSYSPLFNIVFFKIIFTATYFINVIAVDDKILKVLLTAVKFSKRNQLH